MTAEQIQALQKILQLSLEVEKSNLDPLQIESKNQTHVQEIAQLLKSFAGSERVDLQKLAETPKHFSPQMSLRHFVNLMIPVERLLDRQCSDHDFLPPELGLITHEDSAKLKAPRRPIYFILDNIRSAFNVGAIFRLADSVGASQVGLCGYTPSPTQAQVKKTSMQADQFVEQKIFSRAEAAIEHYRQLGVKVVALETVKDTKSIYSSSLPTSVAFLLGNERFGLDQALLKLVDEVRFIPMHGIKNSLNVGQAAAIAAFEWSRQNS